MGEINTDLPIEKVIINDIEVPVAVPSGYANVSDTTATADTVMEGKEFYNAQGEKTVGTYKDMLQYMVDQTNSCDNLLSNYEGTSLDIRNLDTSNATSMYEMFKNCGNLTSLDLSSFDTSNVATMEYMFYFCQSLTNITFGENWDTSKVKKMRSIFSYCKAFTALDISSFDTTNVTDMQSMFSYSSLLTNITFGNNFDTSNVTLMQYMFSSCEKLTSLDLSNFNTTKVTNMQSMFNACKALTNITFGANFNTGNVTNMSAMFYSCNALTGTLDLSNWDMTKVTSTSGMFYGCYVLTNVILPSTIKKIDTNFFLGCNALTEFTILATEPPTLANTTNCISTATTKIKIPAGTLSAYQSATNWSAYSDLFEELPA